MRAIVQRVTSARVRVGGEVVGEIGQGLLVLLGVGKGDTAEMGAALARKIALLRIFADADDKMNLSLLDVGGAALVVSQFTLYADTTRGRRPFFGDAEAPELARALCDAFCQALEREGVRVATGRFGAMMKVDLCNDGPVTLVLDTAEI
jgi:D-tyrosyl-tRNA(Tyr) deacylase